MSGCGGWQQSADACTQPLDALCNAFSNGDSRVGTLHVSNPVVSLIHSQDAVLPASLFRRLSSRVRALGGEKLRSTYQTTFWYEFGLPTSVVEEVICYVRPLVEERGAAGVEWWLSRMRTNRVAVDFHQDRDERLALQGGEARHPGTSSILFLNRVHGGALAVTRQRPNPRNPSGVPLPLDADLVSPRSNRLVWFDGRLTHGVLNGNNEVPNGRPREAGELRLSVVMNWWTVRPVGVPVFSDTTAYAALRSHKRR
jgi:hypothetical protein